MSKNFWEATFGASRRRKDRALLASVEREIANEEKLRAREQTYNPAPCVDDDEKARIARVFGRPA